MTEEALRAKLVDTADAALDVLLALARRKDATQGDKIRILQWVVELGVGKPRVMDAAAGGGQSAGGGVVVLPEAMACGSPPNDD